MPIFYYDERVSKMGKANEKIRLNVEKHIKGIYNLVKEEPDTKEPVEDIYISISQDRYGKPILLIEQINRQNKKISELYMRTQSTTKPAYNR